MKKRNTVLKTTSILLSVFMIVAALVVLGTFAVSAAPSTTTIDGETYYLIGTAEDLAWFANEVNENDKYKINGKLTANIDLSSVCSETLGSWTPISGYQGIFDGAGFEISGLYCTGQEMGGLFGRLYDANAVVKNVTVRGYVSGTRYVGGVVGYLYSTGAKVINCVNYATVSASNSSTSNDLYIGGVVGYFSGGEGSVMENCINYGDITAIPTVSGAEVNIGGITGRSVEGSVIRNCANYGDVSDGDTTSVGWVNAGGIVGFTRGNVINCYNEGDLHQYGVKNSQKLGGIAGSAYDSAKIENCFNNGSLGSNANANLGAVTGELFGTINNTYWNTEKTSLNVSAYLSSGSTVNNTSGLSATELTTGVAAYNMGEAWGQEIGVDATPVLGGMKVYYTIDPATLCTATTPTYYYANSENTKRTHDASMPHEEYENGFCPICDGYEPATDSDGDGYLEIGNAGQLYWFAAQVNGGNTALNAELVANITVNSNVLTASGDLNGNPEDFRAWTPIGNSNENSYRGTFQGNGYVISGLYAKGYGVGFIDNGNRVNVYNLGVLDSYFENTGYASGAIVGYMHENGTVENCFTNATIAGSGYISGGLVGNSSWNATVKNCYYFGKTVGDPFVYSSGSWYNGKCSNNYYVSSVDDGLDFTTAITMEELTSGKLAYMLGGAFGQNIDNGETVQSYPVISDAKVYYGYTTCDEAQSAPVYTNNSAASATRPAHHDFVYAASGSEITKHCGECNKLVGTATITATDSRYTDLPVTAAVSGTGDYASASFVITYTDAEGNSTTTAPVAIGSYTASFTEGGVTASVNFTISKGLLGVSVAPAATHEYGDTHAGKAISGKVVISGNEAVEITGTWAWVDDTTTATFTPDAEFVDLFETLAPQTVTVNVTEATPVITVTSPSPSIMPGMSIILGREVENPYTDTPATLPTSFRYVYKIGESGSLQYQSGEKFTVPSDVSVGDKIYVYVENIAEAGKYSVGQSNVIELLVGQVDYSGTIDNIVADLDAAKADLQTKIDEKADASDLADAITNLNTAITNAQNAAETFAADADDALKAVLQGEIASAQSTLQSTIDGVKAELDAAKADLQSKIDANAGNITANADRITAEVADLNQKITDAKAVLEAADGALGVRVDGVEASLASAQTTLQSAIDGVKAELDAAKADLQSKIDANSGNITANADRITAEVATLNDTIADAKAVLEAADGALGIRINGVEDALEAAEGTLQSAIDTVAAELEAAEAELMSKIDANSAGIGANSEKLTAEVANLNQAIGAAKALLEAADEANLNSLTVKIDDADKVLDAAIKAVQKNLDDAKSALESKDGALAEELAKLRAEMAEADENAKSERTAITVVAIVAVCGDIALLAWLVISKLKKGGL